MADSLTLTPTPELSALVRNMLRHPGAFPWTLQGFGMLRCDIDGRDYRLNVWDRRFRTMDVATLHDHPWDLESLVLSGAITNVIYEEGLPSYALEANPGRRTHYRNVIQPGREAAEVEPPTMVELNAISKTTYRPGEGYSQPAKAIHDTSYVTGTVTLIRRMNRQTEGTSGDRARVYWPKSGPAHWVDATPQEATPEKVRAVCDVALAMWGEVMADA